MGGVLVGDCLEVRGVVGGELGWWEESWGGGRRGVWLCLNDMRMNAWWLLVHMYTQTNPHHTHKHTNTPLHTPTTRYTNTPTCRSPLTVHALRGYLSLELDALPSHLAPVFRDLATLARCSDITVRKEVQALMETRIGPMIAAVGGEAGGKVS